MAPVDRSQRIRNSKCFYALLLLCLAITTASPAQTFTTLAKFDGTNGNGPVGPLVQGFDGNLYATTTYGGPYTEGTVYRITPQGTLTTIHVFCSQFYAPDGCQPYAGLVQARDGNLYGTTEGGGTDASPSAGGTIFKITPQGTLKPLHEFCSLANCADGASPWAGLIQATNGNFYGVTIGGGAHNQGSIFGITSAGVLTTLHSFCAQTNCADGFGSDSALLQATDGNLYGTTAFGGAHGKGEVFKLTLSGTFQVLYSFCAQANCSDGATPSAALIQASDGNFYGTSLAGGNSSNAGTVFKITPQGVLTTVYNFCSLASCADGSGPCAALVQATDGNFYGTTDSGGTYNRGTLFQITPAGTLKTLHSFSSIGHVEGLVQATDGNFYGSKFGKGVPTNAGSIFQLKMRLAPFVETLPTTGKVAAKVIILGTNLTGTSAVSFNGVPATFTSVSNTEITAAVPTGATTGKLAVITPAGTLSSNVIFIVKP
jgi:uncharacterized repeat protein (TIGR03803 family)